MKTLRDVVNETCGDSTGVGIVCRTWFLTLAPQIVRKSIEAVMPENDVEAKKLLDEIYPNSPRSPLFEAGWQEAVREMKNRAAAFLKE